MFDHAIKELEAGRDVVIRPKGNSMTPIIKSGQKVSLVPMERNLDGVVFEHILQPGDIVLARVKGRVYLHKVSAIDGDRYQISNNKGHVNGWTRKIYGVVFDIS